MQDPEPMRVLLVDDHSALRETLAAVLGADPRLEVVGTAANGTEAIETLDASDQLPDVVLVDIHMPQKGGIETIGEIRRRWSAVIPVGLSVDSGSEAAKLARDAGAAGFIAKSGDPQETIEAIVRVADAGTAADDPPAG